MARTHDGLMMLLTVGRNRVLSLVVWFLSCISVHCDVAFSMFFPVRVRWINVLPSCYSCSSSVHSSILCGSGTPRCGGSFLRLGQMFVF